MARVTLTRKCPKCSEWTEGNEPVCLKCGHDFKQAHQVEIQKRLNTDDLHIPVWRIKPQDGVWLRILKRPVQVIQLMLYAVISFLVYLSTAFAH